MTLRPVLSLCLGVLVCVPGAAEQQPAAIERYWQPSRTFRSTAEFTQESRGQVTIHRQRTGPSTPLPAHVRLPVSEITVIAETTSAIWLGTTRGAIRYSPADGGRVSYYAGQRWLPDDHVTGIAFEPSDRAEERSVVWIETVKGFSRIEFNRISLLDKATSFEARVRARHVRWGLTAGSRLKIAGDLSTNQMISTDNDGLWTAMYVAAECFRYAVTRESTARDYARQGLAAMLRLEQITGIPGFPARSFIKIGEDVQPNDGEWHTMPDGQWRWKGDTSSDEIVGHYFVYPIYYDLVADDDEKQQIRAVVTRITNHILDHGYQLIDADGQRTRWGWWGPDAIWADPDETGLRALHLLSHLRVAHHLTGSRRYLDAYNELIGRHRYHLLTRNQKITYPGHVNHSDDELAFLSYYPLLQYETDPKLREVYVQSLDRSWQVERPERNPLWNFIFAASTGGREFDRDNAVRTLREIPVDLIAWTVTNSHRLDVPLDPHRRSVRTRTSADRAALQRAADGEMERQSVPAGRRQRRYERG